jgi:hypothetical protein
MKKIYTINVYCIDEEAEVHCLTFTEKCKNENEKNALIIKSIDYAIKQNYSVYLYEIE